MKDLDWLDEETRRQLRRLGVDTLGSDFPSHREQRNPRSELIRLESPRPEEKLYYFEEKKKFKEEFYEKPRIPSRHSSEFWVNPVTGKIEFVGLSHPESTDRFGESCFGVFLEKPREFRDPREESSLPYFFREKDRVRKEKFEPFPKKYKFEDKRERDEWCGLRRGRDSLGLPQESLRLLARELHPFLYDSTQDGRVVETALRVVQDPRFVELEARTLAEQVSVGARPDNLAERRYEGVVVPALASTMAGFAWQRGLGYLGKSSPVSLDSVEAVRDQINKVNFCPRQVEGIIVHGKVRDAYVVGVSPRAEDLALARYQI